MNEILISNLSQHSNNKDILADIYFLGEKYTSRTSKIASMINEKHFDNVMFFNESLSDQFEIVLNKKLKEQKSLNIFIDSSCLPRTQIARIFRSIGNALLFQKKNINLEIGYSLSEFEIPSTELSLNKSFAPVNSFFSGWSTRPELPVEVIVSLGYEEGKATGAVEYLEPKNEWIFVPHSPISDFLNAVESKNKDLLRDNRGQRIDYEVLDPIETYYKLHSLTSSLIRNSKLVILPFGPKIFFSISLLLGLEYRDISIWHVDSAEDNIGKNFTASNHFIIFSSQLSSHS